MVCLPITGTTRMWIKPSFTHLPTNPKGQPCNSHCGTREEGRKHAYIWSLCCRCVVGIRGDYKLRSFARSLAYQMELRRRRCRVLSGGGGRKSEQVSERHECGVSSPQCKTFPRKFGCGVALSPLVCSPPNLPNLTHSAEEWRAATRT